MKHAIVAHTPLASRAMRSARRATKSVLPHSDRKRFIGERARLDDALFPYAMTASVSGSAENRRGGILKVMERAPGQAGDSDWQELARIKAFPQLS